MHHHHYESKRKHTNSTLANAEIPLLFQDFSWKRKTYVAKLVFPTKQMKFRKAGKLYNNEFNFEAHTHTDRERSIYLLLRRACTCTE